jgi:t-SNARE complex subunit (syntaxin)
MKLLAGWYSFWTKQSAVLLLFQLDGEGWQRKHRVINVHSEDKEEKQMDAANGTFRPLGALNVPLREDKMMMMMIMVMMVMIIIIIIIITIIPSICRGS